MPSENYNVLSIDPGISNLAFYVQNRNIRGDIHECQSLYMVLIDLFDGEHLPTKRKGTKRRKLKMTRKHFDKITEHLDAIEHLLVDVRIAIIESQMKFSQDNVRVEQHIRSYLYIKKIPLVVPFPSRFKYTYLGCAENRSKRERKTIFSPACSIKILKGYVGSGEQKFIDAILEADKKDDLADIILLVEAYFLKEYKRYKPSYDLNSFLKI